MGVSTGSVRDVAAEVSASVATSATLKDCFKYIWIVPMIMAKGKLREIERQIFLAHVMIVPDDSAF